MPSIEIHPDFARLPIDRCADAALGTATAAGASWAEFRVSRHGSTYVGTHDRAVEEQFLGAGASLGVRVLVDGVWGFASDPEITTAGACRAAHSAVALAKMAKALTTRRVELAPLGSPSTITWIAPYELNPFDVDHSTMSELLVERSDKVLRTGAEHVDAFFWAQQETKFYADTHGNRHTQQRIFSLSEITGTRSDADGNSVSLRSVAQPVGRGWEWMTSNIYDWDGEVAELGPLLVRKANAPLVTPGRYDLVIDPTQLWLTIHESIGHATELDRVLGYEANYAGTTFVRRSDVGSLRYGSPLLNVDADRTTAHGLATAAFDDEGVAGTSFPIISGGTLVGLQADRETARIAEMDSTGCSYAEGADHVPLQRMPNISMQPHPGGRSREEMIADVEDGFLVVGDDSWSIDMQRKNFQFTAQQFWRIRDGRVEGMVRNAAYQSTTKEFWDRLSEVGGPQTFVLHGAINCGKGQPGQSAPVSHGAPVARFDNINVLRTTEEGGGR